MGLRPPRSFPSDDVWALVKAVLVGGAAIGIVLGGLSALASVVTGALALPPTLPLPLPLKVAGAAICAAGLALGLWLLRLRRPSAMIVSTHLTFAKMVRWAPAAQAAGRAEPLVIDGPHRYVRHPLYLAATALFLGWGLITGATSSLVWVGLVLLWFGAVQIPFEERELVLLFGQEYRRYAETVPMLIPCPRRRPVR